MKEHFFSSDYHFNHAKILVYENRPFKDVYEMNAAIIKRHNERVKKDDIVFFLGDLGFYASKNAEKRGEGMPVNPYQHFNQLNGNIIRVCGNHDTQANKTHTPVHSITLIMGGLHIQLIHKPEDADLSHDMIICGHVHGKWQIQEKVNASGVPVLFKNVSVETKNYYPYTFNEIKAIWDAWLHTHKNRKKILSHIARKKHGKK